MKRSKFKSTVQNCNYKPKIQQDICSDFGFSSDEMMVVSYKESIYGPNLLSERASFRPKNLTNIKNINIL